MTDRVVDDSDAQAAAMPPAASRADCEDCGAPIIVARAANGADFPLDAEPSPKGNVALHEDGVALFVQPEEPPHGLPLHTSHYVTCARAIEQRAANNHLWRRQWR